MPAPDWALGCSSHRCSFSFCPSILLYGLYAWSRRDDPIRSTPLPATFLISTVCLLLISGLLHLATRSIRRDRFTKTGLLLGISNVAAIVFIGLQVWSMYDMLETTVGKHGSGRGVMGMVIVLAFLHALHVAGGIISLGIVTVRTIMGRYTTSVISQWICSSVLAFFGHRLDCDAVRILDHDRRFSRLSSRRTASSRIRQSVLLSTSDPNCYTLKSIRISIAALQIIHQPCSSHALLQSSLAWLGCHLCC